MLALIIIAVILLAMGVLILSGKGDKLIAGYNAASEDEKSEYDIGRLRRLFGWLLIVLAPATFLLLPEDTMAAVGIFVALTLLLCIAAAVLANTWARGKH